VLPSRLAIIKSDPVVFNDQQDRTPIVLHFLVRTFFPRFGPRVGWLLGVSLAATLLRERTIFGRASFVITGQEATKSWPRDEHHH
jgi:hypothetical protein